MNLQLVLLIASGLLVVLFTADYQALESSVGDQVLRGTLRIGAALLAVGAVSAVIEFFHHPVRETLNLLRSSG